MDSIDSIVQNVVTTVTENYENFIFETVRPFCEEVTSMHISKQQLVRALSKDLGKKVTFIDGHESCPSCFTKQGSNGKNRNSYYCYNCGQKILRSW